MRKTFIAFMVSTALLAFLATGASAAPSKATVHFHPANMHMMAIVHSSGSATITYTAHDASIALTANKLPAAAMLHEKVYVLWLITGAQKTNAGALVLHKGMDTLHAMVMQTKFTKLVVTAEKSPHGAHPMGVTVLTGDVMHH
jgi:hypothetical protein